MQYFDQVLLSIFLDVFGMDSTFGERLTLARERLGWSQTHLAKACDMAATQLSRYESDRATPRKGALTRLALALDVKAEWLATGYGQMEAEFTLNGRLRKDQQICFDIDETLVEKFDVYVAQLGMTRDAALREMVLVALSQKQRVQKLGSSPRSNSTSATQDTSLQVQASFLAGSFEAPEEQDGKK